MIDRRVLLGACAAAVLAGCASNAVVVVSPGYSSANVKKVAVTSFSDYAGAAGSGDVAANTFEKYLLQAGYRVVDASQADALAVGAVTGYSAAREETVMVDVPQSQSDPIYGQVTTTEQRGGGERGGGERGGGRPGEGGGERRGGAVVTRTQDVVIGYNTTVTNQVVPQTQTVPASVSLNVRLLDAKTSELLWSVSSSGTGDDTAAAAESASAAAMKAILKKIK